jgi:hypothetical protein
MKEIPLTQGKVALVDDIDYEYLLQWRWHAQQQRTRYRALHGTYEKGTGKKGMLLMHRVIAERMGILAPQIDHIDRNPLNNQRGNLRGATPNQQGYNKGLSKLNTSGVKGVSYVKKTGRWRVRFKYAGRSYSFGSYPDKEEARRVVSAKRKELHGEFACDG